MDSYEQKYKEALERAKAMIKVAANQDEAIGFANTIFPELKESEDEKIRKELYDFCIKCSHGSTVVNSQDDFAAWATWLEQHGFQKPTDNEMKEALRTEYEKGRADAIAEMQNPAWSEEDDAYKLFAISAVEDYYDEKNPLQKALVDWLKSLKDRALPQSKQEWSEEDIRNIDDIDSVLFYDKNLSEDTCVRLRNWLKSLKDRYSWKPSDEQLEALKNAIHLKPYENLSDSLLWGLYEQLKTLKEY